jgi:hypothetical protein
MLSRSYRPSLVDLNDSTTSSGWKTTKASDEEQRQRNKNYDNEKTHALNNVSKLGCPRNYGDKIL